MHGGVEQQSHDFRATVFSQNTEHDVTAEEPTQQPILKASFDAIEGRSHSATAIPCGSNALFNAFSGGS